MSNQPNETEHGRYEGILLIVICFLVMACLMVVGCKRGDDAFDRATATGYHGPVQSVRSDESVQSDSPDTSDRSDQSDRPAPMIGSRHGNRIPVRRIGMLREVFNDSNKYQYAAAERLGIHPMTNLGKTYFTSRPIVMLTSNEYYTIDSLTHSFPYLVPEAELRLRQIGRNFIDSLARRGGDSYRIMVTSLLRSPHTVKRLRRVNRNAVDSSTHQFGTTFDISFTRFDNTDPSRSLNQEDLKNLLGEVLLDMRNRKLILVKYEAKGGCFHITAVK